MWLLKSVGSLPIRGNRSLPRNPGTFSQGQCTKSHSRALSLSSSERTTAQSKLESLRERLSCVSLGRELEWQPQLSLC